MRLIKVSKAGNIYFTMSDGRTGIIYPYSGYARIRNNDNSRLFQINRKVQYRYANNVSYSVRIRVYGMANLTRMLLEYDNKNCGGLQS